MDELSFAAEEEEEVCCCCGCLLRWLLIIDCDSSELGGELFEYSLNTDDKMLDSADEASELGKGAVDFFALSNFDVMPASEAASSINPFGNKSALSTKIVKYTFEIVNFVYHLLALMAKLSLAKIAVRNCKIFSMAS